MKMIGLAMVLIALMLGLLSRTAVFTVSVNSESIIYKLDANEQFANRIKVTTLPAGANIEVLKCIDTKSDQYMKVLTPSNEIGYLYNLNVVASISLSNATMLGLEDTLRCSLFLLDKFA